MKRTSFLLATLTAITLLSCSSIDNSNSPAEDVNYPQAPALQKVNQSVEVQGYDPGQSTINATGTKCVSCGSMTQSSSATCNFTSLPSNARNISYQFTGSGPSGGGFSLSYVRLTCGNYYLEMTPLSYANPPNEFVISPSGFTIFTTKYAGTPANVVCTLTLYGSCVGTPCTFTVTNIQGCQEYIY